MIEGVKPPDPSRHCRVVVGRRTYSRLEQKGDKERAKEVRGKTRRHYDLFTITLLQYSHVSIDNLVIQPLPRTKPAKGFSGNRDPSDRDEELILIQRFRQIEVV
jgi:hypothetical protein